MTTKPRAGVEKTSFDNAQESAAIGSYTLRNALGTSAKLTNYGATLTELHVPDRRGRLADVVLGFDRLQEYLGEHPHFGGTIGRYANRIAKGKFALSGKEYRLATNNGPNSLHGGVVGFDRRVWEAKKLEEKSGSAVRFTYLSKDGEENFPGNVNVRVTYTLTDANELKIEYEAETDRATVLNLTNHSYFNLAGAGSGDVLKHVLRLNADNYTPVDAALIPTGEIKSVAGTPLDFREAMAIGERIEQMLEIGGYDHNFVVNGKPGTLRLAARVTEPTTGREMEVWTTEPGMQFYSAMHLDGSIKGKGGVAYQKYGALCLETQHFPDSPNRENFPTTVLKPGMKFRSETVYKFSAK